MSDSSDNQVLQAVYSGVVYNERNIEMLTNIIDDILVHCEKTDAKLKKLQKKVRKLRK